jgi:GntR family transcriptional regulator
VTRLVLDDASGLPLYHQLREQLRALAGGLPPHAVMPSETELMGSLSVSRATARRAIADLIYEGVLYAKQGKGTYVAAPRVLAGLERPAGFTETMAALGRVPTSRVLEVARVRAGARVSAALRLSGGDEVYVIERLRLLDGEPCMVERAHVPAALAPGLDGHDHTGSLYDLLEREYGLVAAGGQEVIVAVNAEREIARLLDVPLASALLVTVRTTVNARGVPFEHTYRDARGDLCSFRVSLDGESAIADRSSADSLISLESAS